MLANKKFNFISFHFYYPFILDKFGCIGYNQCDERESIHHVDYKLRFYVVGALEG